MHTYSLTLFPGSILRSDGTSFCAGTGNNEDLLYQDWIAAGNTPLPYEPPKLSPAEQIAALQAAVQLRLDAFAQDRYYDGILSACTYATDKNPRFASDGQACVDARSLTWAACYQVLGEVRAGKRPIPTIEELVAKLPKLEWPA